MITPRWTNPNGSGSPSIPGNGTPTRRRTPPTTWSRWASDVSITCRFYVKDAALPTILYFHGNGEVVADQDYIAPLYNERSINLFAADFRGYGASTGSPNFSTMVEDAHPIFDAFLGVLSDGGFKGKVFVMGRSLGSMSAIELASPTRTRSAA